MMKWTDAMNAQLLELREKGITLTQIGKIMGMSKNSIVGRNGRLMKSGKAPPMPIKIAKPVKAKLPKPIKIAEPIKVPEPIKPKKNGKPPIIDVHPEYDAVANVWFFDKYEAGSIRQLLEKLPPGSTVKDYSSSI